MDELTGENALVITDFAEDEDEVEDAKDLWQAQVDKLRQVLGCESFLPSLFLQKRRQPVFQP